MSSRHHICICICTYKRPAYLIRLLRELEKQETEDLFDYSIVVVDNDSAGSAKQLVESHARQSKIPIKHVIQQEQSISLARNKAIEHSMGDFLCFIDDDEYPGHSWLIELYKAIHKYKVDGMLGPVLPDYEITPPKWVLKGRFFDRPSHPSGHILKWKETRTGNVILKRELFLGNNTQWFDPAYGSGGEDRDLFRRRIDKGYVFAWSNEAPVYETVPQLRWNRTFMIKRALLRGKVDYNTTAANPLSIMKSLLAITIYTMCLPVCYVLEHHIFMTYLVKNCDHIGKVLAALGFDIIKEKYITS